MENTNLPSKKVKYASFWIRFLAYAIDLALISLILFVLKLVFQLTILNELDELVILFCNILYNVIMVASSQQATIGKILLGIIIVDDNMNRLSILHSFGRCMAYYFSYITLGIGFLLILITKKHQGLHDKIAHTYVIYR